MVVRILDVHRISPKELHGDTLPVVSIWDVYITSQIIANKFVFIILSLSLLVTTCPLLFSLVA